MNSLTFKGCLLLLLFNKLCVCRFVHVLMCVHVCGGLLNVLTQDLSLNLELLEIQLD